jgi:hypothetical protein
LRRCRILVFRTGRTLKWCIERLLEENPNAEIWVVHAPGCDTELRSLGISSSHSIVYRRSRFFTFFKFLTSRAHFNVIRRRYDRVVILYTNVTGEGYKQLDAIARFLGGSRSAAFKPNGVFADISPLASSMCSILKTGLWSTIARLLLVFMVDLPLALKHTPPEVSE